MTALFSSHPRVHAVHMDDCDVIGDGFACWASWHGLPVDLAGVLESRKEALSTIQGSADLYLEANPLLGPFVGELEDRYIPTFIFIVRDPADVVRSHLSKGWYEKPVRYQDRLKIPGYQAGLARPLHGFSRLTPSGMEFDRWEGLTRAGRIAWLWNAYNMRIWNALKKVPGERVIPTRIENLDFPAYEDLCKRLNLKSDLRRRRFDRLRESRPGKRPTSIEPFTQEESAQILHETQPMREIVEAWD